MQLITIYTELSSGFSYFEYPYWVVAHFFYFGHACLCRIKYQGGSITEKTTLWKIWERAWRFCLAPDWSTKGKFYFFFAQIIIGVIYPYIHVDVALTVSPLLLPDLWNFRAHYTCLCVKHLQSQPLKLPLYITWDFTYTFLAVKMPETAEAVSATLTTNRHCTIEITNVSSSYCLINPK